MLEQKLLAQLYRYQCPSSEQLGEFQLGLLTETTTALVQEHVDGCPHCQAELTSLQSFMADTPLPYGLEGVAEPAKKKSVRVLVAELISGMMPGQAAAAPAVRGSGAFDGPQMYGTELYQFAIEVNEAPTNPVNRMITGLMLETDPDAAVDRVNLIENGVPFVDAEIDEFGNFVFDQVRPGLYALQIVGTDVEINLLPIYF